MLLFEIMAHLTLPKPTAAEIASAINSLMQLDPFDHSSLLVTIEDYFTTPSRNEDSPDDDSDSDTDEVEPDIIGK